MMLHYIISYAKMQVPLTKISFFGKNRWLSAKKTDSHGYIYEKSVKLFVQRHDQTVVAVAAGVNNAHLARTVILTEDEKAVSEQIHL